MTLVQHKQAVPEARIGAVIADRYRIDGVIGQGGFGAVYKARHTATGDAVAIKVLRTDVRDAADVVARFRHEAKGTSKLKHPNTVRVFDFGQMNDGNLYLAMEFLDGRTLSALLRAEGPLLAQRLVHIAAQVLKSLSEAHSKGLVHRDLKPDNIFLQNVHGEADFVKVLDFGIAKSLSGDTAAGMTGTGAIIGTPRYMSPEQAQGASVDARTDLYSLGIILHEGLTGTAPFVADSPLSMILRRVTEAPPRAHDDLALPTPRGVCDAVWRALASDPEERFASADDMAAALHAGLDTPVLPARPDAVGPAPHVVCIPVDGAGVADGTFDAGTPPPLPKRGDDVSGEVMPVAPEPAATGLAPSPKVDEAVVAERPSPRLNGKRLTLIAFLVVGLLALALGAVGVGGPNLLQEVPSGAPSGPVAAQPVTRETETPREFGAPTFVLMKAESVQAAPAVDAKPAVASEGTVKPSYAPVAPSVPAVVPPAVQRPAIGTAGARRSQKTAGPTVARPRAPGTADCAGLIKKLSKSVAELRRARGDGTRSCPKVRSLEDQTEATGCIVPSGLTMARLQECP